ncbi:MAG: substrate-binding domain-containing protein [Thiolinea sp.]
MNLKELSQKLGLSQTTVSRALNGYPEVGEKTRERVLKTAAEMNYRPNRFAKSLATGKTGHIGIIYPVERNLLLTPLFNEFLGGVTRFLVEKDMDLTIMPVHAEHELQTYQQLAKSGRVDGMILSSPLRRDPRIEHIANIGIPFILHGRLHEQDNDPVDKEMPFSYLDIDNSGAFERATELLINMGHSRIALINDDARFTFAWHRLLGYRTALEAAGIQPDPELIFTVDIMMTEENGYQAAMRALKKHPAPTAFLVSSVIMTLGVKRAIRQMGLRPGKDISIITHDDELPYIQAAKFDPPLTTVSSSIAKAGYEITSHLYDIIESGNTVTHKTVLEVDLIVRGSTSANL